MLARDSKSAKSEGDSPEMDYLLPDGQLDRTPQWRAVNPRGKRGTSTTVVVLGTALAAVSLLALALLFGGLTSNLPEAISSRIRPSDESTLLPPIKRVLIRPVGNIEGIGSALQRIKGSMVIADIVDATFLLGEAESEHSYSTSRLLNGNFFGRPLPIGKTCALGHYILWTERPDLVRAHCNGTKPALAEKLRQRLESCAIIIDEIPEELYEDLNGCIRPAIRERLGGVEGRRLGTSKKLSVGIHIRWGDAAGPPGSKIFRGSMGIDNVNMIMRDVRNKYAATGLDIRVAMENHDQSVLDGLEFTDYAIIDSKNMMGDLKALADTDLTLLGGSSYAALANIMAPKGLTIVEGVDEAHKFYDSGREVALTKEYTPHTLDALDEMFGWY